ncbi:adenine deaminase [Martelella alba]|uniref:Adenine deaminase n=1 Tax=Martelella alba TaxID=2590451 RepID=A0A506U4W9_9HYPH|nr:adenine deaminase C-terminal domain-containing protein [Martelella alba]TPW28231.1 adenine deaminase [Martelella alba]
MIDAKSEVRLRQQLTLVALGKQPADRILRVGRLLDTATRTWSDNAEIVIKGERIAYVGPAGSWPGDCEIIDERPDLMAIPGLGEVHKHIESSHLTPEWEAALVMPRGNTWTCEASHEFSNVRGSKTLDFWMTARQHGSPLKIFPLPGSAVPPTAYEHGGGYLGYDEQRDFLAGSLMVAGLDEVMDWPAVWNPDNASHDRLWGMIEATIAARGVVEGHAAGLKDLPTINAFAAAGLASDHEAWTAEEFWDKLTHGLFAELRPHSMPDVIKGLLQRGLADWSQIAFATDDRSASETLSKGATDYNVRLAIQSGLQPEIAIQCVTINPARHMRLTPWVGTIAPGRFADIVLLSDLEAFTIAEVWADGRQVSKGHDYILPVPEIAWPDWARDTVQTGGAFSAADFAITAETGRETMTAAVLRPFHWEDDFLTYDLPVKDGQVQRDTSRNITKFAIVDRYSGKKSVSKMFWAGTGPKTPNCALASSLAHDKHNIWCVGSSDEAMAEAVNALREIGGGWALVNDNKVVATVRYEIAGLMSQRSAKDLDADMRALYAEGDKIEWMFEPSSSPRWWAGFPERLAFATLTCAPWRWVLVAPSDYAPEGLVNVSTGATHKVVW